MTKTHDMKNFLDFFQITEDDFQKDEVKKSINRTVTLVLSKSKSEERHLSAKRVLKIFKTMKHGDRLKDFFPNDSSKSYAMALSLSKFNGFTFKEGKERVFHESAFNEFLNLSELEYRFIQKARELYPSGDLGPNSKVSPDDRSIVLRSEFGNYISIIRRLFAKTDDLLIYVPGVQVDKRDNSFKLLPHSESEKRFEERYPELSKKIKSTSKILPKKLETIVTYRIPKKKETDKCQPPQG